MRSRVSPRVHWQRLACRSRRLPSGAPIGARRDRFRLRSFEVILRGSGDAPHPAIGLAFRSPVPKEAAPKPKHNCGHIVALGQLGPVLQRSS